MNPDKLKAVKALKLEAAGWIASADYMAERAAVRKAQRREWLNTEDGRRRYQSMIYSATKRIKRARAQAGFLLAKARELENGSPAEIAARIKDAAAGADILAQL